MPAKESPIHSAEFRGGERLRGNTCLCRVRLSSPETEYSLSGITACAVQRFLVARISATLRLVI